MHPRSDSLPPAVRPFCLRLSRLVLAALPFAGAARAAALTTGDAAKLPIPLADYGEPAAGLLDTLGSRIHAAPFNLVATVIFLLAIIHTFFTAKFRHWAHVVEERHAAKPARRPAPRARDAAKPASNEVSFAGQMLHFLGEVEAVFGIWAVVLIAAISWSFGWSTALDYVGRQVSFTEPMFVVVIMALAGTRPILRFAEQCLHGVARIGGATTGAWWLSILIVAPLLGSCITEPAAMTIAALLLARRFYALRPSPRFAYATLGLLFANISIGGTLTHFAAPPILMVAAPWQWSSAFMFLHFGWKAVVAIVLSTLILYGVFRRELAALGQEPHPASPGMTADGETERPVPPWITVTQLLFMAFTVAVAHYPPLFIGGFLLFLAFSQATAHHQARLDFRPPLLVGFFLAGLVVHGGLQAWWIEPVLRRLGETPLFLGSTILTAFNDNAAITYLATLVPGFTDPLKYAVVAGAVAGGGLTVIANAPNPAGQAILRRFFPGGVSPLGLLLGALLPTAVAAGCFLFL